MNENTVYQIDGKNYRFKQISVEDLLRAKNALQISSTSQDAETALKAQQIIDKMSFKYLEVENEGEWVSDFDMKTFSLLLPGEGAAIDITLNFTLKITDFLKKSPSFQRLAGQIA